LIGDQADAAQAGLLGGADQEGDFAVGHGRVGAQLQLGLGPALRSLAQQHGQVLAAREGLARQAQAALRSTSSRTGFSPSASGSAAALAAAAAVSGNSIFMRGSSAGVVTMKITRSTSITSTNGVTLISLMAPRPSSASRPG